MNNMEFEIKKKNLSKIIGLMKSVNKEGKMVFTPNGVHTTIVDEADTIMAAARLDKEAFESLDIGCEKQFFFNIDIKKLSKVLDNGKANEIVNVRVNNDNPRLIVTIGKLERALLLLKDVEMPQKPNINLETWNSSRIATESIATAVQATDFTTRMIFDVTQTQFCLRANDEEDSMEMVVEQLEFDFKLLSQASFNLNYLKRILTFMPEEVSVNTRNDHPLIISFADGSFTGEVLIAPLIDI